MGIELQKYTVINKHLESNLNDVKCKQAMKFYCGTRHYFFILF